MALENRDLDRILQEAVRCLLRGECGHAREIVAAWSQGYIAAYLREIRRAGPALLGDLQQNQEQSIAGWEVAQLLAIAPAAEGGGCATFAKRLLVASRKDPGARAEHSPEYGDHPGVSDASRPDLRIHAWRHELLQMSGESLVHALQRLLRGRSIQGTAREIRERRPEIWRLYRTVKQALRRHGSLRLRTDHRGCIRVESPNSDRSRRVLSRGEIESALTGTEVRARAGSVVAWLPSLLTPAVGHGGHCYLLDLVSAVIDRSRAMALQEWYPDTAVPDCRRHGAEGPQEIEDQVSALRAELVADACTRAQDLRWGDAGNWIDVYARLAVESYLRGYGFGQADWARMSLSRILREHLGSAQPDPDLARHRSRVDYLTRLLRCGRRAAAGTGR